MHIGLRICQRLLINIQDKKIQLCAIVSILFLIIFLFYGMKVLNRIRSIILTILIVWLLARWCEDKSLWYKIDSLTIYFVTWQCVYLTCKWEDHDLLSPFLFLQQGSLCVSISLESFLFYDIIFRYIPIQLNIAFFWLWSLYDM
jgi:hypothetical protein